MKQKSLCGSVWVRYEIAKLNRLEKKVLFSNKCNEVSLDIDFEERWYGRKWCKSITRPCFSQMCQCERSVALSDDPDGNIHTKGSIFFYLVAICSLNSWWSFIV